MPSFPYAWRRSLGVLGLLVAGLSCSDQTAPAADAEIEFRLSVASALVASVVVEVTASDITTPLVFNLPLTDGSATGTVNVPAGSGRTITVRAFDQSGVETHRGTVTRAFTSGANPPVAITLLPLGSSTQITVTFGTHVVTVAPSHDTVAASDTVRFHATVTDGATPLAVQVRWASLNPAVATVDSTGLVRGVTAGSTAVVATYGGSGALAQVQVGGGSVPPPALSCLSSAELDLVSLVNAMRADSGRAPLTVDTRLVRLARLNVSRVRDATTLDSVAFDAGYGVAMNFADFAWGFSGAAGALDAWITDLATNTARRTVWAGIVGQNARLIGVVRDVASGPTATPRWMIAVSTSSTAAVTSGTCDP